MKLKKGILVFILLSFITSIFISPAVHGGERGDIATAGDEADILVYGGELGAISSAITAAAETPEARVALVIPYTSPLYGGLAAAGGQNFWDLRFRPGENKPVQQGSFARWLEQTGRYYNTNMFSRILEEEVKGNENITVYPSMDILDVEKDSQGRILKLTLQEIKRESESGRIIWGEKKQQIEAEIFIDGSMDGRLARLAEVPLVTGRKDWPGMDTIDGESNFSQQAATLMFKVTGVRPAEYGDMIFHRAPDGSVGAYGGSASLADDPIIKSFNEKYGPQGFALKPLNAAQNGVYSQEFWVNALLVFKVDGRAHYRDRDTENYPSDKEAGSLETDEAWARAREVLLQEEFLEAFRQFPGFSEAHLVLDQNGEPITGDMLYLRETVHASKIPTDKNKDSFGERDFTITPDMVYAAGTGPENGADQSNYPTRIGLGYYWLDINAYEYQDMKDEKGSPVWPVTQFLRPEFKRIVPGPGGLPSQPVYIPFEALHSQSVPNLLLPGYAAGISSFAWSALRVLPCITVMGDAAGVGAAHSFREGLDPADFSDEDIEKIQHILRTKFNALLDK
ncbi:MAG: FAD-dependent oxidoreductase [Clostridia bacterium]|nr:FAD-dependent oxidoreductase [Clostridia bacterium]